MDFQYYNANPLGKNEEDCVCRAISTILSEDYNVIKKKLHLIAELFDCDELCMCCYQHLLDKVYGLKKMNYCKGMSIKKFLHTFPKGKFLIRVNGHLTCAKNGKVFDTWDCTKEIIDVVWEA